jgi:acyl-coenzyme A thioesterase PaaI-like protein
LAREAAREARDGSQDEEELSSLSLKSLQETYAPQSACFGCGPANERGLRIRSFAQEGSDVCVCRWTPEAHHIAFPGVLNGGICGALLDCHSNWAAAVHLMKTAGAPSPPSCVTLEYAVRLSRPTPIVELLITARIVTATADRATVDATIEADGKVTASCRGIFVAVKPGHPAYHRW